VTFMDNGIMNGDLILGWIRQFSDGCERHFCQFFSKNLQSIPNLTKTTHSERSFCPNKRDSKMVSPVHLLHKKQCYFVLFMAKFVI
jgi:hypothetical protein